MENVILEGNLVSSSGKNSTGLPLEYFSVTPNSWYSRREKFLRRGHWRKLDGGCSKPCPPMVIHRPSWRAWGPGWNGRASSEDLCNSVLLIFPVCTAGLLWRKPWPFPPKEVLSEDIWRAANHDPADDTDVFTRVFPSLAHVCTCLTFRDSVAVTLDTALLCGMSAVGTMFTPGCSFFCVVYYRLLSGTL